MCVKLICKIAPDRVKSGGLAARKKLNSEVCTKVWKKLHDLFVDKKDYINRIISASIKERQVEKAHMALDQFKAFII